MKSALQKNVPALGCDGGGGGWFVGLSPASRRKKCETVVEG